MTHPLTNVLIDSIPQPDRSKLSRHVKAVTLPVRTVLYESDDVPEYVHFITSGIASIVTTMLDGTTTEVGTVGREGAPQGVHLLGPVAVSTRCFMQIAGTALRIEYGAFAELFNQETAIRQPILAYAQYQSVLLGQVAGCNRLHGVEPRLARWLLMVQDRIGSSTLKLTQEFVGQMIGSQRTTVSAVAGALQARGFINYKRGIVRILDRPGLEHAACECYPITHKLLQSLYDLASQKVSSDSAEV